MSDVTITQESRQLALGCALGDDAFYVRSATYTERLGQPFTLELDLTLVDAGKGNVSQLAGSSVTLRLSAPHDGDAEAQRYVNGVVSRVRRRGLGGVAGNAGGAAASNQYSMTVVPDLWLLGRTSDCRIWQDATATEVLDATLSNFGRVEAETRLSGAYRQRDMLVQYRETTLNFVQRLCEDEGIYYYFQHEDGGHRAVFCDDPAAHEADEHCPPLSGDADADTGARLLDWTAQAGVLSNSWALGDFDPLAPRKDLAAGASHEPYFSATDLPMFDHPGGYGELADGEQLAERRQQAADTPGMIYGGVTRCRHVHPGRVIEIVEHPDEVFNGKFLVVGCTWHATNSDPETGGNGGQEFVCRFDVCDEQHPFRPQRAAPKPLVQGPQTAIVSGPSGSELHVDEHGRVKVQFHWDRYGTADENSSAWIRVAKPIAGNGWGFAAWPRIGQEVVVDFLEGDPDRPLIVGGVYNGTNKPPYKLPDEVTKSTFKSNSTPGGDGFNELRFEDKDGKEQIFVHAQRRMDVRVRGNLYETNYGNREERVGWEKDGETGGDLNTLVKLNHNFHLQGDEFNLVDKNQTTIITEEHEHSVQKGSKNYVKELYTLYAEDMHFKGATSFSALTTTMTLEGSRGVHVLGGEVAIEAKGGPGTASMKAINIAHEASAGVKIKAPMIAVEGQVISLKSGGNEVTISPAGVTIIGTLVRINSGPDAKAIVSASAKAATAAEDVAEFEPLEAIDAYAADDGKTGKKTGGRGGGGRSNQPRTLEQNDVKPYLPPPPPPRTPDPEPGPVPPPVPPPEHVSEEPCGIQDLVVFDTEAGQRRNASDSGVLQIVGADGATTMETAASWFGGTVSVSFKKQTGGTDKVGGTVTLVDEASGGPKLMAIVDGSGAPPPQGSAAWKSAGTELPVPGNPNNDLWAGVDATPTVHQVYGCGCDDVTRKVKLEVYPSQQYEAKIGIGKLRAIYQEINDFIEYVFGELSKNLPVTPIMNVQGPGNNVTIGGTWGWKEEGDWKAAWNVGADVALDPLFGLTLGIEASLIKCAGLVFAIPPRFSDPVARYGADVFVEFSGNGKVSISGGPRGKWFTDGTRQVSGEIKPSGEVKLSVAVGGRVGSERVLGAELKGSSSSGFGVEAAIDFGPNGLGVTPKVEFLGLELAITLTTSVWDREVGNNEFKVQAIDKKTIYPRSGDGRIQILPDE